ncbi:cobalt ECF transporter T component CbiQ [Starkeya koreensis]|uniref:Cobalt ECF transporter T component CbiQ n=1 Tax=Ancylobacter koreensis TaxID=266121 RepID=A0ABT0DH74_9HYPH|nr:cobalt ECF transporter T component CbiQ [Ancylobacter koreensis]MCK0206624.1 cobalt ECF transporter T component CbiQ [Ancylobacter koreensis]
MILAPTDLRLRLAATSIAVACLSQLRSPAIAAAALAVALALWLASPARRHGHRLLHVEGFVLLLFLTLPFTVKGAPVFTIGPLAASAEGFARAALVALKMSAALLLVAALLGDLEPARLGGALRGLRVPEPVVRLFVLTARYVGLIRDEARRLREAMRVRAFRPRTDRHTWRSYGNLIGMLLVRALDRARRVEEAMACRGYDGRFPYAPLPAPLLRDWAGFALLAGGGILALAMDIA